MRMIPSKIEYDFEVLGHTMRSSAEHLGGSRRICYYFDGELVSSQSVPDDDFTTDDDCICDLVQAYSRSHTDVYADLFQNHPDKVSLTKKTVELQLDNDLFLIDVSVVVESGRYSIVLSANGGEDRVAGSFTASSFSEALEKTRMLISTLDGVSAELTRHISEFSSDRVMELIRWRQDP